MIVRDFRAVARMPIQRQRLRTLGGDCRGGPLMEFALVAAPMMALMIATIETGLTYFAQDALETAAETAARTITTGQAQTASQTQAQFKTAACASLPSFMSCANLMVDVQTAATFGAVNAASPTITFNGSGNVTNTWAYSPGVAGSIVVMRLMYIWSLPTGPLGFNLGNLGSGSKRLLIATSVAKTEPYT